MEKKKVVPREKLGRKARRALDREKRAVWAFSPVTRKVESKKRYDRNRRSHDRAERQAWDPSFPGRRCYLR